jgi:hypothetical protein
LTQGQHGSAFVPPRHVACASCNAPVVPDRALYSNQGELVCDACFTLAGASDRIARAARGIAIGTLGAAVVSWFCNPFFIPTIIAIGNAIGALRLLVRPEVKATLGSTHGTMMALSIIGLVLAVLRVALDVGVIALSAVMR